MPNSLKLSDWLNPVYGANPGEAVRTHVHTAPFRHAVFPNFFRADVVHEIARRAESILTSPGTMNDGIARRAATMITKRTPRRPASAAPGCGPDPCRGRPVPGTSDSEHPC